MVEWSPRSSTDLWPHHGQKGEPQLAVGGCSVRVLCGCGGWGAAVQAGLEMGGKGEGVQHLLSDWLLGSEAPPPSLGSH